MVHCLIVLRKRREVTEKVSCWQIDILFIILLIKTCLGYYSVLVYWKYIKMTIHLSYGCPLCVLYQVNWIRCVLIEVVGGRCVADWPVIVSVGFYLWFGLFNVLYIYSLWWYCDVYIYICFSGEIEDENC